MAMEAEFKRFCKKYFMTKREVESLEYRQALKKSDRISRCLLLLSSAQEQINLAKEQFNREVYPSMDLHSDKSIEYSLRAISLYYINVGLDNDKMQALNFRMCIKNLKAKLLGEWNITPCYRQDAKKIYRLLKESLNFLGTDLQAAANMEKLKGQTLENPLPEEIRDSAILKFEHAFTLQYEVMRILRKFILENEDLPAIKDYIEVTQHKILVWGYHTVFFEVDLFQ